MLKKFDRILDSIGIITQKKGILEFSSLLYERDTDLPEIGGRLGIYSENSEIFHATLKLMIITSKYFIKTFPQLEKLKSLEKGKIFDERTQMTENLIMISSEMKKYLNVLYINNVIIPERSEISKKIMKIGSFIRELFYNITGDEELKKQPRYRKFDQTILKEQIAANSNIVVQKILKGDQKAIGNIIDQAMEFLEFKSEKKNYFRSLCYIITSFVTNMPFKDVDDVVEFQASFKMTSLLLDIDEDHLEFVLDILSGNPYRIFKCMSPSPRIDLKTFEIVADFLPSRLGMISDIFNCTKKQVKKLSAAWIHAHDLVHRGESNIKSLGADILQVDPMFFYFLIKKTDSTYRKTHQWNKIEFNESIKKFIEIHLQRMKIGIIKNIPKEKLFFENLRIEEQLDYGEEGDPGIDNLPSNHTLVDTPFDQINGRTNEDILDYIRL